MLQIDELQREVDKTLALLEKEREVSKPLLNSRSHALLRMPWENVRMYLPSPCTCSSYFFLWYFYFFFKVKGSQKVGPSEFLKSLRLLLCPRTLDRTVRHIDTLLYYLRSLPPLT